MNRVMAIVAVAWASVAGGSFLVAQEKPTHEGAMRPVAEVEGVSEYVLENGARVLLYPDPSSSSVTVNMTVLVGSRHEGYGEAGMAHLLEHMLFKGSPKYPDVPKALQDRGASFNGTTWLDRTNYFETLPATGDNLEFALSLEADRLVNSFVRGEDLQSEMTVVRNEFERGENSPQRVLMQRIQAAAYEWHNYGKNTIGNRSDIERVPITNLRDFYRRHYQPDNIVLIIGGKFEPQEALELVQKHFGALPRPERDKNTTYTEEPPQDGERTVALRRVGEVAMVGVAYHIPAASHPQYPAVEVLSTILGMEPSGRLYRALVETKLASSVHSMTFDTHDPGILLLICEVRKEDPIEDARQALLQAAEGMGEGVAQEEVDRAKQILVKDRERTVADVSRTVSQLSEWSARGDWRLFFIHRDRLEKVTAQDVQAAAEAFLARNNRTVGLFIPTDSAQRVAIPSRPNLAELVDGYQGREAVSVGEEIDVDPLKIQERTQVTTLPGGLKVALLPKKTRGEAVHVTVNLRYGDQHSLAGQDALCALLPIMMTRGVKNMTHDQFQAEFDKYGATLQARGGTGLLSLGVQTKRANLAVVLDLIRQALREPTLAAEEFALVQREEIASLESQQAEPIALAQRQLRRTLSPHPQENVRYVPTIAEETQQYKEATAQGVRRLYEELLGGGAGELVIVGDFEPQEVEGVLRQTFDDWTSASTYQRIDDLANDQVPGGTSSINTPDKANSVYVAGLQFPLVEADPDYPAMVMANFVLGGGSLSSRLGNRVRQQEGLSYSVGSQFSAHPLDPNASVVLFAIANPENSGKLAKVIQEELEKLSRDGVTEEELQRAKQGYLERAKLSRTNDRMLLALLGNNLFVGRTLAFQKELEDRIANVTVQQVNQAWRKHVDLNRLVVVTAGDFKQNPSE